MAKRNLLRCVCEWKVHNRHVNLYMLALHGKQILLVHNRHVNLYMLALDGKQMLLSTVLEVYELQLATLHTPHEFTRVSLAK